MKTLGILGGVGPQTTAKIYLSVIDSFRKRGEKKYPSILIYNLPFPFIIEEQAIIQGINSDKMIPYLIEAAKILEQGKVDFGILPCNTLHKYIGHVRDAVQIPLLSILEETAQVLMERKMKSVGILATETTINTKIYEDILRNLGIDVLYPEQADQEMINSIIIEILHGVQNNFQREKVADIIKTLHVQGAETVLLACTDLQLIVSDLVAVIPVIDTTEVLINASVREMLR